MCKMLCTVCVDHYHKHQHKHSKTLPYSISIFISIYPNTLVLILFKRYQNCIKEEQQKETKHMKTVI